MVRFREDTSHVVWFCFATSKLLFGTAKRSTCAKRRGAQAQKKGQVEMVVA